ncbi:MAG: indole-3-glycerol phosphate synthase TrpC [Gemmatimonadaceae bacterium]
MQEQTLWHPPVGALGRLTAAAHVRARDLQPRRRALEREAARAPQRPPFAPTLANQAHVAVIAELKRRSPSRGAINEGLSAVDRVREYIAGGASCISVLTEPEEFGGSGTDLSELAAEVSVPLLKKDFHVDESQILEARALGASAMLFIARAIAPDRLIHLAALSREIGVEPLIEVRTEVELDVALAADAAMIGVNARDLETLEIDPNLVVRLIPRIPKAYVAIAESGISSRADVERVAAAGASAVLVGSSLSLASDARGRVAELASVPRILRGA